MNKLYRSEKNKKIAGVIGGRGIFQLERITPQSHNCHLSHYDKVLPVLLIYIIWIFIVPSERDMK